MTFEIARDQLKAIVERVERLENEIKDLNADKSDIYKEARANGFDVKAIKKVVAQRKIDSNEREEADLVFETYWNAVHGLGLVHAHAREKIEEFDPITGEFVEDNSPETAERAEPEAAAEVAGDDLREPVAAEQGQIIREGDALRETGRFGGDASSPDTDFAMASQGEAVAPSVESVSPEDDASNGSPDANTGGDHVAAQPSAAQNQAGGLVKTPPAKHPILLLRPNCKHPGEEICGGSGRNHCRACTAAMREEEMA